MYINEEIMKEKYETAVFTIIRDSRYGERKMNISKLSNKEKKNK